MGRQFALRLRAAPLCSGARLFKRGRVAGDMRLPHPLWALLRPAWASALPRWRGRRVRGGREVQIQRAGKLDRSRCDVILAVYAFGASVSR